MKIFDEFICGESQVKNEFLSIVKHGNHLIKIEEILKIEQYLKILCNRMKIDRMKFDIYTV